MKETGKIVVKFGGSVLKDHRGFADSADYLARLRDEGRITIGVVSAPKGVTNSLKKAESNRDKKNVKIFIKELREKYDAILGKIPARNIRDEASNQMEEELNHLKELLLSSGKRDEIVSKGETHSGIILSHMMRERGCDSTFIDGYSIGVTVNSNGGIEESLTLQNIKNNLERYLGSSTPIVGGYVGRCMETNEYRLLGDNTTDVTGALVASAGHADIYEIVKDVPGIYRVEPEYGKKDVIPILSYDEASQITWRGSEVVHPLAIQYAKHNSISIRVKNLKQRKSTLISRESSTTHEHPVAAISARRFYLISVEDDLMDTPEGRGYLSKMTGILSESGVDISDVSTSPNVISVTIPLGSQKTDGRIEDVLKKRLEDYGYHPNVQGKEVGGISITGEAMQNRPGTFAHLAGILGRKRISIIMGSQSDETLRSPNIIFYIRPKLLRTAVNAYCEDLL